MDGRAFAAGIAGFNQGVETGERRKAARAAGERQAREDAWTAEERGRTRKKWAAEDAAMELSARQRQLMARFGQVAALGDNPASAVAIQDLYNSIPDGHKLETPPQRMEDGTWVIDHPLGRLQGSWNEMLFGEIDPQTGAATQLGLVHLIDPQLLLKNQESVASEAPKAARDRMNNQSDEAVAKTKAEASIEAARTKAAGSRDAAGIRARSQAPTTKTLEDGTLAQWDGQAWVRATDADGNPVRPARMGGAAPTIRDAMGPDGVVRPYTQNPQTGQWEPLAGPNGPLEAPPSSPGGSRSNPRTQAVTEALKLATDVMGAVDEAKFNRIMELWDRANGGQQAAAGGDSEWAEHVEMLRANPTPQMRAYFDEAYGEGAAQEVLGR